VKAKVNTRTKWFLSVLGMLLAVLILADLLHCCLLISIKDIFDVFSGQSDNQNWIYIVRDFRLPKALTAILAGAGLSVAGLMMQTMFRNPLAGPYVLGISSGASLGVALFQMAAGFSGALALISFQPGAIGMVVSAVIGSALVMLLVIMVSTRVADSVSVLIIGIMFGSITGAVVSVLQFFSDPDSVHSFLVWTFGSVALDWNELMILAPLVLVGVIMSFVMQKPLNAFLLGENYARGIGVNAKRSRLYVILLTSVIAGAITAFTGPIAFIGMAVPHLTRNLLRTSDHRLLLPGVIGVGSALMLVCDMISQLPGSNQTLPINSVTAIFGAPVVVWVIIRGKRGKSVY
jgi:iron complex transport system permease protein